MRNNSITAYELKIEYCLLKIEYCLLKIEYCWSFQYSIFILQSSFHSPSNCSVFRFPFSVFNPLAKHVPDGFLLLITLHFSLEK